MTRPAWLQLVMRSHWMPLLPASLLFMGMEAHQAIHEHAVGMDSHAYWVALRSPDGWYSKPPGSVDAYLYSPAFVHVLSPLAHLSWPSFQLVWFLAQVTAMTWLLVPLGWRRSLVVVPMLSTELLLGNVYLFYALALAVSLGRGPGSLSLPILTKVTPGVTALWFVARGEWGRLIWAALWTLTIAGISLWLNPQAWGAWLSFLSSSGGSAEGYFAGARLVMSAVLVVWAARTDRPYVLAFAMVLGCPVIFGYSPFAILAAIPRLLQRQSRSVRERAVDDPAPAAERSEEPEPMLVRH